MLARGLASTSARPVKTIAMDRQVLAPARGLGMTWERVSGGGLGGGRGSVAGQFGTFDSGSEFVGVNA